MMDHDNHDDDQRNDLESFDEGYDYCHMKRVHICTLHIIMMMTMIIILMMIRMMINGYCEIVKCALDLTIEYGCRDKVEDIHEKSLWLNVQ